MVCRFRGRTRGAHARGRRGSAGTGSGGSGHHLLRDRHRARFPALRLSSLRCRRDRGRAGRAVRFHQRLPARWCRSSRTSASTTRRHWATRWMRSPFRRRGIIKRGVPVVSGVKQDGPRAIIRRIAAELDCALLGSWFIGDRIAAANARTSRPTSNGQCRRGSGGHRAASSGGNADLRSGYRAGAGRCPLARASNAWPSIRPSSSTGAQCPEYRGLGANPA